MARSQEMRLASTLPDTQNKGDGDLASGSRPHESKHVRRKTGKLLPDPKTPLGLDPSSVRIVEHDPNWTVLFDQEKARILEALGHQVLEIAHVGSTSVPGLPAKPIIDVAVAIRDLNQVETLIPSLVALNYQQRPEIQIPGEVFFRKIDGSYHLHMVEHGSTWWRDYLHFRDYLRKHPEIADEYLDLKNNLAAQYAEDRPAYTKGKANFIQEVLDSIRKS